MSELRTLRRSSRALEPERVIAALDAAFAAWRAADSSFRAELASRLDTYSPQVLDLALPRGLRHWNEASLRAIRAQEWREPCRGPELTAVWLASSVPSAVFSAIALPLLAGSAVYAKPSTSDPVSAELFVASLRAADAAVGAAVCVGEDKVALEEADAVVAYGRDETLQLLRQQVRFPRIFVGHGHKLSAAALGPGVETREVARELAQDAAIYDGRGCLSPAYLLVVDRPRGVARAIAEVLADELEALRTSLPRGALSSAEHSQLHELRARLAMDGGAMSWLSEGSTEWGVFLAPAESRPAPGMLRNLPVVPLRDRDALRDWCAALAPHLSSLAVAGWGERREMEAIALAAGASRLCPPGSLQFPRLEWRHDGGGAIAPLLRGLDVEPS